jgi:hypothetical protein
MKFRQINLPSVDVESAASFVVFTRLVGSINTSAWVKKVHAILTNRKIRSKSVLVMVYHYSKTMEYRQELFNTYIEIVKD